MTLIRVCPNLLYDTSDCEQQVMDLYIPLVPDEDVKGVVMWIPGGAWFHCDHRQWNARQIAKLFASSGYIVASVKYRVCALPRQSLCLVSFMQVLIFAWLAWMSGSTHERKLWMTLAIVVVLVLIYLEVLRFVASKPLARFPVPLLDCVKAWNLLCSWVDNNEDGTNKKQLVVAGHSAGAHLAMMLSLHVSLLLSVPSNVVCFSGIYSPDILQATFIGRRIAHILFGDDPTHWPACFPLYHVVASGKERKHPAMLLINGHVEYGLIGNMLQFCEHVKKLSPDTYLERYVISNTSHFSIVAYWDSHLACVWFLVSRFLQRTKSIGNGQ